jgi:hypothetical protein
VSLLLPLLLFDGCTLIVEVVVLGDVGVVGVVVVVVVVVVVPLPALLDDEVARPVDVGGLAGFFFFFSPPPVHHIMMRKRSEASA